MPEISCETALEEVSREEKRAGFTDKHKRHW